MNHVSRILIVDDEPANVRVLAETLRDRYALSFARRGAEALELVRRVGFDLILMDVMMPGMDGLDVLARLQENPATEEIPVIFVTAMDQLTDEARGLECGAVDYITKPINPAIVRARVRTHLELKRQRDLLANLANIDGLTGIANRRRFDRELDLRWTRQEAAREGIGLLMADIDHFKQYNDHYGHDRGDDCLRQVAGVLESTGKDALVARYGGEEFALLCSPDYAKELAASCLAAVQDLEITHAQSGAGPVVTISIGGAVLADCSESSRKHLFRRADQNLYAAKKSGRNQAVTCDQETEPTE